MAFQPFKAITSVINGLKKKSSVLQGPTIPNFSTVASKKGVINYNPTNADYSSPHTSDSNKFFVYPLDVKDQEHYILFDIIERTSGEGGSSSAVGNTQLTKIADNLNQIVYGANRFFRENSTSDVLCIQKHKSLYRVEKNSIAVYMPQTLK